MSSNSKDVTHTLPLDEGSQRLEVRPILLVAEWDGGTASFELKSGSASVGSDSDCELVVEDKSVSRRHLLVELLPAAVRVRDNQSRNGTWYLKAKVGEARIPVGGSIRIGKTTLKFLPVGQHAVPESQKASLHGLLGAAPATRALFSRLEKLSLSDATVLIQGESGVGKEAVARALHAGSARAKDPFVAYDCAAAGGELIDSELFGHVRGAFTGADRDYAGAVERAGSGTLLLDEVAALPLELQPRLLRMLEAREFKRVGDGQVRPLKCRVIATTQQDLAALVKAGIFRGDLRYRLAVVELQIPPLRDRPEDIPVLARHFARSLSGVEVELNMATLASMQCDPWPGNVRELRNAVQRVLALGNESAAVSPSQLQGGWAELREQFFDQFEKDYLTGLLKRHGGNVSAATREAKLARSQMYRLLDKHGLAPER